MSRVPFFQSKVRKTVYFNKPHLKVLHVFDEIKAVTGYDLPIDEMLMRLEEDLIAAGLIDR